MKCTWKGCQEEATEPQLDKYEVEWACLCRRHATMLGEAIEGGKAGAILRAWVLASGGSEKLTKNVFPKKPRTEH